MRKSSKELYSLLISAIHTSQKYFDDLFSNIELLGTRSN